MSMNRELNMQLFLRREADQSHVEYIHEYGFYENIAAGNIENVQKILADPDNVQMYESPEYGRLSKDMLRNIRYHFVVSAALITRLCAERGLERELAYTLSDLYISRMDMLNRGRDVISLHNEMLMDFTRKMAELPKSSVYSIHIVRAIEFIRRSRTKHITAADTAAAVGLNRSYMSSLFAKEVGISLSSYIRSDKIKAAADLLKFSEYSYSDIAEYLAFSSQSHFIKCFREEMGVTPKKYREELAEIPL